MEFKQLMQNYNPAFTKKTINCELHGENVESTLSGKCVACMKVSELKDKEEEFEAYIHKKKESSGLIKKEKFLNARFDNYEISNQHQQEIFNLLKSYNLKENILLLGKTGTGKTHLACALIDKFLRQYKSCYYVKFYQLAKIQVQDKKLYEAILGVDFLVIDEYGASDSDAKSNILFEVIDQRYDQVLPTMLLSNLSVETFKSNLSDAIYSRIKEDCIAKLCNWEDYRIKNTNPLKLVKTA